MDQQQCSYRILFISFCDPTKPLHKLWIEEWMKKYDVELLLDPTRSAYEAWALSSSVIASWGIANGWYYFKAFCCRRGEHRHKPSSAVQGDSNQLGADFVLAPGEGTVVLKHYCSDPTDRIPVDKIREAITKCCATTK